MSPVASHGRAIGYLIPPFSWIVLAAVFISSNVFGGCSPTWSNTSLRYAMMYICACMGSAYSLPSYVMAARMSLLISFSLYVSAYLVNRSFSGASLFCEPYCGMTNP